MKEISFGKALILLGIWCLLFAWYSEGISIVLSGITYFASPIIVIMGLYYVIKVFRSKE